MTDVGRVYEGFLQGEGLRFGLVVSRFNEFISSKLLSGALDSLSRHGVLPADIEVAWVPGAMEIPLAAKRMARSAKYDGIVCLGAVIRGSTPHFEYISAEVAKGVASVQLESGVPITFGVLTTDTIEQAVERAGTKAGNKGWDSAQAALEMVNLLRSMPE
ncbi:MAG: 6,7-dimethyl-8-ribityllumazine synthase [Actinobacteria bacterium]|nr:6,7-dimethyl-8-ribityllumazine synthase [Actinomycetota bacterium]